MNEGFVFSLESLIAVLMVISAVFILAGIEENSSIISSQTSVIVDDALFFLENSGYIVETVDSNSPTQSAGLIRERIIGILPEGYDANITVRAYDIDKDACASNQDFDSCFPDENRVSGNSGNSISGDYVSGKKVFLRKQPPGDCNVDYLEFSGAHEKIVDWVVRNLQGAGAFFAEEDVNVIFDVTVSPSDAVVCDENVTVELSITVPEAVRKPIDLVLVLDRSGSMSWNGRVATSDAIGVYKDGDYVYIADNSSGVRSADVSNPLIPSLLDRYDPGTVEDVHGNGTDYIFLSETRYTDELIAVNKSNPANIYQTDTVNFDLIRKLFVSGNYAYIAGEAQSRSDSGLVIMNISNPYSLSETDRVNTSDPRAVFVSGDYAYLADGSEGLVSINVSDKSDAYIEDTYNTPGTAVDVVVSGNYAYVADGSSGLIVLDVSDPSGITLADSYDTPGYAYAVDVYGGYAYVADGSSGLHKIDVSDPEDISFERTFATPYTYEDVDVDGGHAYLGAGTMGLITIDVSTGPRLDNAKNASKLFVDYNGWTLPPDQMGVVEFGTSAYLTQALTSDIDDLNSAIDSILSTGSTNIADGIYVATAELTGANANPSAMRFQVLLSDGQSNYGDSEAAAQAAAGEGIVIFTIGFGADADEDELTAIAELTGGEYFAASDANALQDVFDMIALAVSDMANDSNVSVPVIDGATISDLGGGALVDGNISFDAGDITIDTPWTASYTLVFPCDSIDVCGIDALTFPGPGTSFNYMDIDGNYHSIDFNASATLEFRTRDLQVEFTGGETVGSGVSLDLYVRNIGELDSNSTTLRFYLDDTQGELLADYTVPGLCSQESPGCSSYTRLFSSVPLSSQGVIYATINDDNALSECPLYNIDAINCYAGPETQIIVVEYTIGRGP